LAVINPIVTRFVLDKPAHLGLVFHFATMFFGTLVYRLYSGELEAKTFKRVFFLALIVIVLSNLIGFYGKDEPEAGGTRSFIPMTTAWLAAYFVFLTAYRLRDLKTPRWCLHFGLISYSLYLMHPLVVDTFPHLGNSFFTLCVEFLLSWGIAWLCYHAVEKLGINWGRRVIARMIPPTMISENLKERCVANE